MKRISLLFVVLFAFVCVANAQATKAQDNLNAATSAAQGYAPDAQLIVVESLGSVGADGTSGSGWLYAYISYSHDSAYAVEFVLGHPFVVAGSASTASQYNYNGPVSPTWVNSDQAMDTAEAHGGSTYRSTYQGATVTMILARGSYASDTTKTVWLLSYTDNSNPPLYIYVDAQTGQFLGKLSATSVDEAATPKNLQLDQNYPNPFSASTAISFTLNAPQNVTLTVYNELGRQVATLASGRMDAGVHNMAFDASSLPQGVYFYKLTAGDVVQTRQMMVVK